MRACGLSRREVAQLAGMGFPSVGFPFRRVSIDPVRGVAVMMAPSRLHERIAARVDKVAEGLGGGVPGGLRLEQLRGTRWRDREGPRGAGAEADCAFYVGETAEAYLRAEALGDAQADDFTERHPPDLVVEINVYHTDEGKPAWVSAAGRSGGSGQSPPANRRIGSRSSFWICKRRAARPQARESKVIPGAQPGDVKEGLRVLQDAATPAIEGVASHRRGVCADVGAEKQPRIVPGGRKPVPVLLTYPAPSASKCAATTSSFSSMPSPGFVGGMM